MSDYDTTHVAVQFTQKVMELEMYSGPMSQIHDPDSLGVWFVPTLTLLRATPEGTPQAANEAVLDIDSGWVAVAASKELLKQLLAKRRSTPTAVIQQFRDVWWAQG